jgi:predicted metalloendopeptidase
MPDREYYLSDSRSMRDLRYKYQKHVSAILKLAGFADPDVRAQHIIELEHAIAERHAPLAEEHNIYKANNTWKQADFAGNALASTGRSTFAGPVSLARPASSSGSPQLAPESRLSLPRSRWTHGKTGWPST